MKNTSTKIVFFGNERLVSGLKKTDTPVLRGLIEHGYNIQAIISHHSESKSRNQRELEVAEVGKEHNIPVLLPARPTDIYDKIAAYGAEIAVLVAYGRIIPQRIIDLFPKGIINIHPSLLPKYRGPTPIESAIANGDTQTGVSIMRLTAGMDTGPVYGQATISLSGSETKFEVCHELAQKGANLLLELLPQIIDGSLHPTDQNEAEATYSKLLTKADAWLEPSLLTASKADQLVRAHLGFPKSKLTLEGQTVIVTRSHVTQSHESSLDIACKDNFFLHIDEVIAPSGRYMSGEAFLRGYAA